MNKTIPISIVRELIQLHRDEYAGDAHPGRISNVETILRFYRSGINTTLDRLLEEINNYEEEIQ